MHRSWQNDTPRNLNACPSNMSRSCLMSIIPSAELSTKTSFGIPRGLKRSRKARQAGRRPQNSVWGPPGSDVTAPSTSHCFRPGASHRHKRTDIRTSERRSFEDCMCILQGKELRDSVLLARGMLL